MEDRKQTLKDAEMRSEKEERKLTMEDAEELFECFADRIQRKGCCVTPCPIPQS
jgi:hypothetical protein